MCRYDFNRFRCRHFFPTGSEPCGQGGCRRRLEQIHTLEGLCPDCAANAGTPPSSAAPPPPSSAAFSDWLADQQDRSVVSCGSGLSGGARPGFPRRVRSDSTVVEVGSPRPSISDGNWGEDDAEGAGPRPVRSAGDGGRPGESSAGAASRSTRRAGTRGRRTGTGSRATSSSSSSSPYESGGAGRPRSTVRDSDDVRAAAPPATRTSSTDYEDTARATSVSSPDQSSLNEHDTGAGPCATNSSGTVCDIKPGAPSRTMGGTAGTSTTSTTRTGDGNAGAGPGSGGTRGPRRRKIGAGPRSTNSASGNAGAGSRSMGSSSRVHNRNIGTGPRSANASKPRETTAGAGPGSMSSSSSTLQDGNIGTGPRSASASNPRDNTAGAGLCSINSSSSSYESNAAAATSRTMSIIGRPEADNDTGAGLRPASSSRGAYETNTAAIPRAPRARNTTNSLYGDDPRAGARSIRSSGYDINTSAATPYESRNRADPQFTGMSGYESNTEGIPRTWSTTRPYEDNDPRAGSRPTSRGSGGSGSNSAATAPPTDSGQLPISTTPTSTQGTNRSSLGTFVERRQPKLSRSPRPSAPLGHADSLRSHPISPALATAATYLQVPPPPQQKQQRQFQTPAATTVPQDISAILYDDRGRSLPGPTHGGTLRRVNAQIHARGPARATSRTSSRPPSRESEVIDNELWAGANKHEDTWGLHEGRQRELAIEKERWSQALIIATPSAGPGSIESSVPAQGRARPRRAPAADKGGAGRPSRTAVDPDCGRTREAPNASRSRSRPRQSPARSGLDLANKPLPPLPIDAAAAAPTTAPATPTPPSSHYNDELFFPSPRRTSSAASFISAQDMDALERATSARDRLPAEPTFHDNDELFFPSPRRTSSAASFISTEDMDVLERATSVRDRLRSHLLEPVRRPHFTLAELDSLLGYGPGPAGAPADTSDDLPDREKAPQRGGRL